MNMRSAREYAMFAYFAHLFRNCREQQPSNYDDLDISVTGGVYYLLNFCPVLRD